MRLIEVRLNKYKSYTIENVVNIDRSVTRLVGKNESGKTAFLEALAKFKYFDETDSKMSNFDEQLDYPRKELVEYRRKNGSVKVISCEFEIDDDLLELIKEDIGESTLEDNKFVVEKYYGDNAFYFSCLHINQVELIKYKINQLDLSIEDFKDLLVNIDSLERFEEKINDLEEKSDQQVEVLKELQCFKNSNEYDVQNYIVENYLDDNIPCFWYFDEYYELPYQTNLNTLKSRGVTKETDKVCLALFELANITIDDILNANEYEYFISILEATSNDLTSKFKRYWSTNDNLELLIDIRDEQVNSVRSKILRIRVKNTKHQVTLPISNRSKGFNWFLSFFIWFSKIEFEKDKKHIILLDEPGLNLHATAQEDLIKFIDEVLSPNFQVIYTTHSPFMIDSINLHQVRTVYESDTGTIISEAIDERDADTLFPLQAALGYDIAQNLFITKNNLLVEGVSDLVILTHISNLLEQEKREYLSDKITVVPTGGLDKVATFISLLRGSKLNIACILDYTFETKNQTRGINNLLKDKIIKEKNILYFNQFTNKEYSDLEDMFSVKEYLELFNKSFDEYEDILDKDIEDNKPILPQISKLIRKSRFNHYRPVSNLASGKIEINLSNETLERFEELFKQINSLFKL